MIAWPALTRCPSPMRTRARQPGAALRKTSRAIPVPQTTPGCLATIRPESLAERGRKNRVVTSPRLPRSSLRAAAINGVASGPCRIAYLPMGLMSKGEACERFTAS